MSERNPPLGVKLSLTLRDARRFHRLLELLTVSGSIEPRFEPEVDITCTFILNPPKHVTNYAFWAENVERYAKNHDIPALIVRP